MGDTRSSWWRLVAGLAVVPAVAFAAFVWAGDGGDDERASTVAVGASTWTGLSDPPVPVSHDSTLTWIDDELIVFGGDSEPSSSFRPSNAAAAYSPASDSWRTLPEPPVSGLYSPAAVWTGSELVVAGVRCSEPGASESASQECSPGGVVSAAYNPDSDDWTELRTPRGGVFDPNKNRDAATVRAIGWDGSHALFDITGDVWGVNKQGAWRRVPANAASRRSNRKCAGTGTGAAVAGEVQLPDVVVGNEQDQPNQPRATASVSRGGGPFGDPRVAPTAPESPALGCTDTALVMVDAMSGSTQIFDPASEEWRSGPSAPVPLAPGSGTQAGDRVLFINASQLVAFNPAQNRWSTQPVENANSVSALVRAGDNVIVRSEDADYRIVLRAVALP